MTKAQLKYLRELLTRIKDPDGHVAKAIAYVDKDLAQYDARVGQLRDNYEVSSWPEGW